MIMMILKFEIKSYTKFSFKHYKNDITNTLLKSLNKKALN